MCERKLFWGGNSGRKKIWVKKSRQKIPGQEKVPHPRRHSLCLCHQQFHTFLLPATSRGDGYSSFLSLALSSRLCDQGLRTVILLLLIVLLWQRRSRMVILILLPSLHHSPLLQVGLILTGLLLGELLP